MKTMIAQWLKCYKSYWYNLLVFVLSIMFSTLFLGYAINDYCNSELSFAIINLLLIALALVLGFSNFKKFNDKNRYKILLQVKKLLEEQKIDQR